MTFSLVARCPASGMFGVGIASSSPAVAARCAWTRAGVGAVASQNVTDPRLGNMMLDRLQEGHNASDALQWLQEQGEHMAYRQVLAIDVNGLTALHSGEQTLGIGAEARGRDVLAAGNLLDNAGVPQAMVGAFETTTGHLGDRLLAGLQAALGAGGEAGPVHSAGIQIADQESWPVADLRCDWTEACPIESVSTAWDVYAPQLKDYVQRALDPRQAPSYGVPGED